MPGITLYLSGFVEHAVTRPFTIFQDFMLHALLYICFPHHWYEPIKSLQSHHKLPQRGFYASNRQFWFKITYTCKESLILLICGHNTHLAGSVKIAFSVS